MSEDTNETKAPAEKAQDEKAAVENELPPLPNASINMQKLEAALAGKEPGKEHEAVADAIMKPPQLNDQTSAALSAVDSARASLGGFRGAETRAESAAKARGADQDVKDAFAEATANREAAEADLAAAINNARAAGAVVSQ